MTGKAPDFPLKTLSAFSYNRRKTSSRPCKDRNLLKNPTTYNRKSKIIVIEYNVVDSHTFPLLKRPHKHGTATTIRNSIYLNKYQYGLQFKNKKNECHDFLCNQFYCSPLTMNHIYFPKSLGLLSYGK